MCLLGKVILWPGRQAFQLERPWRVKPQVLDGFPVRSQRSFATSSKRLNLGKVDANSSKTLEWRHLAVRKEVLSWKMDGKRRG